MAHDASEAELVAAWRAAADDPAIGAALRSLHAIVANEVRQRRPICLASGRCCHFEAHGHRLYVTGLEAAWCVRERAARGSITTLDQIAQARERGDCPYLVNGRLCGAHAERPLGCRIYFCDRSAQAWQQDLYERTHRVLVELHERHAIPYRYGEWRGMLERVVT